MLEVKDLSASYGQHRALDSANLHVERGEIVVILGANGAGKSTLLKAISGICEGHVTGSILMNGQELVGEKPDRIVEHGIAVVPEGRGIFVDLNVEENLMLGGYAPRARDEIASNLERTYTLFPKLRERRKQVVRTMSGGEQQMVAISRAMMSNPTILTLDEPSLGLAPVLCKELFQSLKAVRETGIGILLVEQNARASLAIADRGYLLENAHIIHQDSAENLSKDPAVQKAYLGGAGKTASKKSGTAQRPIISSPTPPRPASGPSPSDIAAAAMQNFATPKPQPTIAAPPVPVPVPAQIVTPPTPTPTPLPVSPATPHGIDLDALVNKARTISSAQLNKPNGTLPTPSIPAPKQKRHSPARPIPDLASHSDRLQTVLAEIESAASSARSRTRNRTGRKY